jgi:hypothetical protein
LRFLVRELGRVLQKIGLVLPPIAIILQLTPGNARGGTVITLGQMLALLGASVCCFLIGRILEGYGK